MIVTCYFGMIIFMFFFQIIALLKFFILIKNLKKKLIVFSGEFKEKKMVFQEIDFPGGFDGYFCRIFLEIWGGNDVFR